MPVPLRAGLGNNDQPQLPYSFSWDSLGVSHFLAQHFRPSRELQYQVYRTWDLIARAEAVESTSIAFLEQVALTFHLVILALCLHSASLLSIRWSRLAKRLEPSLYKSKSRLSAGQPLSQTCDWSLFFRTCCSMHLLWQPPIHESCSSEAIFISSMCRFICSTTSKQLNWLVINF